MIVVSGEMEIRWLHRNLIWLSLSLWIWYDSLGGAAFEHQKEILSFCWILGSTMYSMPLSTKMWDFIFLFYFFLYILDIDSINTYCWNFDWGWVYVLFPQELFMFNLFWIFFIKLSNNNVIIWVSLNKQMRFVWSLIQQSFSLKCFRI